MGTGHEGEGQELCSHWSLGRVLILFGGMALSHQGCSLWCVPVNPLFTQLCDYTRVLGRHLLEQRLKLEASKAKILQVGSPDQQQQCMRVC